MAWPLPGQDMKYIAPFASKVRWGKEFFGAFNTLLNSKQLKFKVGVEVD